MAGLGSSPLLVENGSFIIQREVFIHSGVRVVGEGKQVQKLD